jgi:hypothetical protein
VKFSADTGAHPDKHFVLKRGGRRLIDPVHTSSEFLTTKMYELLGIDVPPTTLYKMKVE